MIHQDAALFGATLSDGQSVTHSFSDDRKGYLVPSRGTVLVNGTEIGERAGAAISGESEITVTAHGDAEIVLADLP
jgi:redox-sensitive bicupin YhaK (pirin superfamily)